MAKKRTFSVFIAECLKRSCMHCVTADVSCRDDPEDQATHLRIALRLINEAIIEIQKKLSEVSNG